MQYTEITVRVAAADAEAACDAVRALTAADVWIERPFTQPNLESDALVDNAAPAIVHVYVPMERTSGMGERMQAAMRASGVAATIDERAVDEEDWAESWKEHFHVERFGERLVVVPSWRTFDPQPSDVVLTLDPGMAFGTGQHETTRMCLEAIERLVMPGARVLDVGCGSGILSVAAARLGASDVVAVDVDENCVRITADNAHANGAGATIHTRQGSLGASWPFDGAPVGFDVVVANIIAPVIVAMARELIAALAPGGRVVASGIIGEREAETCAALEAAGARIDSVRAMGDWRCIEGVRG